MVLLPNLTQKMQKDITDGVFSDVMPPIRLLAQQYNVGESTMKLSLKQLKDDGFLFGYQGKCIKVNPLVAKNHFFKKNIVFFIKFLRLQQPLYSQVIESLRTVFEANGAYVHLINSIQQLKSCNFDIDIIIATETKGDDLQYITEKFPQEKIVLLNGYSNTHSNVGTDNFHAGYEAIKYLHEEKKHNSIGILSVYLDYEVSFNKFRRDGANEYCRQHPEVKLVEADTENFNSTEEAIDDLFTKSPDISAIFATMDTLAFNVFAYAAKKNIAVPAELAVLGFDNTSFCKFTIPTLSSFGEDIHSIIQTLLKLTQDKLKDEHEIRQYLFPPSLIKREST